MNYELFIAKRIIASKQYKSSVSAPIIKIAIIAIALGIVIMMITIATGIGLQQKIREKIAGFNGHIQVTNYDNNNSEITVNPILKNQNFYPKFKDIPEIKHEQIYATKAGIIRTKTDFEGIILKGVGQDYDWNFFKQYLVAGTVPNYNATVSDDVLISKVMSNRLGIKLGDSFNILFVKEDPSKPPFIRVMKAVGIYNTGFNDFDKNFVISDIRHIQKMNKWDVNQIGGFEFFISDFKDITKISDKVYTSINSTLNSQSIVEKYPAIFEWIGLFDTNIYLIIGIMILVAGINMITALLVLILERAQMIGILKALGSNNFSIRKVFLYNASYLILKGLFWGNIIGIAILLIQKYFKIVTLNPETYYVNSVPIYLNISYILFLNIGTLLLCLAMLLIPSIVISKINPAKSIKFE